MYAIILLASAVGANAAFGINNAFFSAADNVGLQARQADDGINTPLGDCMSAIADLTKTMPTPPPELAEIVADDPCVTEFPDSLSEEASSYGSSVLSWISANSEELVSANAQCTDFADQYGDITGSDTCEETGSPNKEDAAPRDTAMLFGVILAAAGAIAAAL